jgi:hypothetical protein
MQPRHLIRISVALYCATTILGAAACNSALGTEPERHWGQPPEITDPGSGPIVIGDRTKPCSGDQGGGVHDPRCRW